MPDSNDLRQKRAEVLAKANELHELGESEDRELTAEEQTQFDELLAEAETLAKRAERADQMAGLTADLDEPQRKPVGNQDKPTPGPEAKKEFESLDEWLVTVIRNPNDQRLVFQDYDELRAQQGLTPRAEQTFGDGSSGGFAVPTQFRGEILQVEPASAIFRPRARVIPAGSPPDAAITMPALDQDIGTNATNNIYAGVTINWTGEGADMTETDADLRQITLQPHEMSGYITLTNKLMRNWAAASGFAANLLRQAVTAFEDQAFINGDAIAKPQGVIGSGAERAVNRAVANQIAAADIDEMLARLLRRGTNPIWVASQSTLPQLLGIEDTRGARIFKFDLPGPLPMALHGVPLMYGERLPTLGSKGDLLLLDLNYYLIKDGSGPFVDAGFATGDWEANKGSIKIVHNVDGQPWMTSPLTDEAGYVVSPFVVLDVPSS